MNSTKNSNNFIAEINGFSNYLSLILNKERTDYISKKEIKDYEFKYNQLVLEMKSLYNVLGRLKFRSKLKIIREKINQFKDYVCQSNENYLTNQIQILDTNLKTVSGYEVDEYQLRSLLIEEDNVLVIAGAGSGKTMTIVAKIKYLLLHDKIDPKELLILTYTKAATEELKGRILAETGIELNVFTFHKLGKDIIAAVDNKVPELTQIELKKFISSGISDLIENDAGYLKKLVEYLCFNRHLLKTHFDFENEDSYEEYLKMNPLITLNNERVKSIEELTIANFLAKNSIEYIYEKKYIVDTSDAEYGCYYPDFYLPKYDIWIEHFAINKNNEVPPFFKGSHGKSPKESYWDSIKWKRNLHKTNKTTLIETYSYESIDGNLLANLRSKLFNYKVGFQEISDYELFKKFEEENKSIVNGLTELFETVITMSKNNGYTSLAFNEIAMKKNDQLLKELIMPLFFRYEKILKDFKQIDFSDMLNIAIDYLKRNCYKSDFKYVIVDEYQDMSKITYNILTSLRENNYYKLYCVGDDWQSIYRFAGSDVNYITDFSSYFGETEICIIPNTYRFSSSIVEISSDFIMQNPRQLKKNIISKINRKSFDLEIIEGNNDKYAVIFMEEKLISLPDESNVLFLGRYKNDIKILDDNPNFSYEYSEKHNSYEIKHVNRPDLKILFRTVHASKGLQSDYVFIINNKKGNYGFPSQIQDNSILDYLLTKNERYPYAEERRLYYVALTRTKNKVWLVTVKDQQSIFVDELKKRYQKKLNRGKICPECGGILTLKTGKNGQFLGCGNYPKCKYTKNIVNKNKS